MFKIFSNKAEDFESAEFKELRTKPASDRANHRQVAIYSKRLYYPGRLSNGDEDDDSEEEEEEKEEEKEPSPKMCVQNHR